LYHLSRQPAVLDARVAAVLLAINVTRVIDKFLTALAEDATILGVENALSQNTYAKAA